MALHHRAAVDDAEPLLDAAPAAAPAEAAVARFAPIVARTRGLARFFAARDSHALVFFYCLILLYGASFTLTLTVLQAFAVAGLPRRGARAASSPRRSRGARRRRPRSRSARSS